MIHGVTKVFDAEIKRIFLAQPEILNFLLKHERKSTCIKNLCYEIHKGERSRIGIDITIYNKLITDYAKMFARAALEFAEQQALSANEKQKRIAEANRIENAEAEISDLEKRTLHDHKDEDWAKIEIARRKTNQI